MMIACYTRFSSGKDQTESSIDSQKLIINEFSQREFSADISLFYQDSGICGVIVDRPGFQSMLRASESGDFQVLLIDDLSRLSRDDADMKKTLQRLIFRGVRVVAVADGYDSSRDGHEVTSFAKGFVNHIFRSDLKKKTLRGQKQAFLSGHHTGGRCYGYLHIANEHATKIDSLGRPLIDSVKRVIDETQAEIIRKIFQWYAIDKQSAAWIANELNKIKVTPPRGSSWSKTAIYGHFKKGTGILNNQLYIGVSIWNRSEWLRDPDTGRRVRVERPESEWVRKKLPELRIVSDELWTAAKNHQKKLSFSPHDDNALSRLSGNQNAKKYLLSGLLICGCCGSKYVMVNGERYGCGGRSNRGQDFCSNKLTINRSKIESILLQSIKDDLLSTEAIDLFRSEVAKSLNKMKISDPVAHLKKDLVTTDEQLNNILNAILDGIRTKTTLSELQKLENKQAKLQLLIDQTEKQTRDVTNILPRITDLYKTMVKNINKLNVNNIARVRSDIESLLCKIVLLPDESGKNLNAEVNSAKDGFLRIASLEKSIRLVAGTGFSPNRQVKTLISLK